MAGEQRVTFDFLEVATFKPGTARDRPYQSWGTERIYIDQDTGGFISLVHILEMRLIQRDGSVSHRHRLRANIKLKYSADCDIMSLNEASAAAAWVDGGHGRGAG